MLKIFVSTTTAPDMQIFTQKRIHMYKVKIRNCKNCDPRAKTEALGGVQS